MTPVTTDDLIDYLAGELSADRRAAVAAALAADDGLATELAELETALAAVTALPEPAPGPAADARFAELLAAARNDTPMAIPEPRRASVRRLRWLAAAAAAVLLIFSAGRLFESRLHRDVDRELAATRSLMLELMNGQRTSARIRATTVTLEMTTADPVTTANLGYLLRRDPNPNVRLAALDALRRFPADERARDEMVRALGEDPPPVVRLELIETLVGLDETRALPYLRDMIQTDTLPRPLRDAAELASFKLI